MADLEQKIRTLYELQTSSDIPKLTDQIDRLNKEVKRSGEIASEASALRKKGDFDSILQASILEKKLEQLNDTITKDADQIIASVKQQNTARAQQIGIIEQLEKKIKDLGEAQKKASDPKELAGLNKQLKETESELENAKNATSSFGQQFGLIAEGASGFAAGLAGGVTALTGLVAAYQQAAATAAEYDRQIKSVVTSTGVSKELAGAFSAALESQGGDIRDAADALLQLGQRGNDAATGQESAVQAFRDLGVSATDSTGKLKPIEQIFRDIDAAAAQSGLSQKQLIALSQILGEDSSKKLLPLLGNFQAIEEQAKQLGLVLDNQASAALDRFRQQSLKLEQGLKGVGLQAGAIAAEQLTPLLETINETIAALSKDKEFTAGLRELAKFGGSVINGVLTPLLAIVTKLVEGLSFAGNVLSGFKQAVGALTGTVQQTAAASDDATEANKNLSQSYSDISGAINLLVRDLERLQAKNKENTDAAEDDANKQLTIINSLARQGLISQEEAAKAINAKNAEILEQKQSDAASELAIIRSTTINELAARRGSLNAQLEIAQNAANERKRLEEDLAKESAKTQEPLVQAEAKLAKLKAQRALFENRQSTGAILTTQRLTEAIDAQSKVVEELSTKDFETRQRIQKQIDEQVKKEQDAGKAREEIEDAIHKLKVGIGEEEVRESDQVDKELIASRKKFFDAENKARDAQNALENGRQDEIKRIENGIVEDKKIALDKIADNETKATNKLKQQLSDRQIKQRDYDRDVLELTVQRIQDQIKEESQALSKLQQLDGSSLDKRREGQQRLLELQGTLIDAQKALSIKQAENDVAIFQESINRRKQLNESFINEVNLAVSQGRRKQADADKIILQATLETQANELVLINQQIQALITRKATDQEINDKITERNALQNQALQTQQKAREDGAKGARETLAAAQAEEDQINQNAKTFLAASAAINKALADLGERLSFGDVSLGNLDAARDKLREIVEVEKDVKRISGFLNDAITQAELAIVEQKARELAGKIAEVEKTERLKAQRAIAEETIRIAKEVEDELVRIKKEAAAKEEEIRRQVARNIKKLLDQRNKAEEDAEQAVIDAKQQAADQIADINREIADRAIEEAEREKERTIQLAIDSVAEQRRVKREAEEKDSDARVKFAEDLAEKEAAIRDKAAELAKASVDKNVGEDTLAKLRGELDKLKSEAAALRGDESARQAREAARQKAIAEAQRKTSEKNASAKTADEIEANNAALDAEIDKINKEFDLEEEFQAKIKKAKELGSEEAVRILQEELERKKKLADDAFEAEKSRLASQLAEKQRVSDLEKANQQARDAERIAEVQRRLDDELGRIKKQLEDQQTEIDKQIEKEKNARRNQINQLRTDTQQALDDLNAKYKEFFDKVGIGAVTQVAQFDDIIKKLEELSKQAKITTEDIARIFQSGQLGKTGEEANKGSSNTGGVGFNLTASTASNTSGSDTTSANGIPGFNITSTSAQPVNQIPTANKKFTKEQGGLKPKEEKITPGPRKDIVIGKVTPKPVGAPTTTNKTQEDLDREKREQAGKRTKTPEEIEAEEKRKKALAGKKTKTAEDDKRKGELQGATGASGTSSKPKRLNLPGSATGDKSPVTPIGGSSPSQLPGIPQPPSPPAGSVLVLQTQINLTIPPGSTGKDFLAIASRIINSVENIALIDKRIQVNTKKTTDNKQLQAQGGLSPVSSGRRLR